MARQRPLKTGREGGGGGNVSDAFRSPRQPPRSTVAVRDAARSCGIHSPLVAHGFLILQALKVWRALRRHHIHLAWLKRPAHGRPAPRPTHGHSCKPLGPAAMGGRSAGAAVARRHWPRRSCCCGCSWRSCSVTLGSGTTPLGSLGPSVWPTCSSRTVLSPRPRRRWRA
jgi:hypothetical protein